MYGTHTAGGRPPSRLRRTVSAACALLTSVAAIVVTAPAAEAATITRNDLVWGVLDSTCTAERALTNRNAGISMVVVEAAWDRANPRSGTFDDAYLTSLAQRITTCADAGLRVVLGSGVQYPPSWVRGLGNANLRDQRGAVPITGQLDGVWNSAVVNARTTYLRRLVARLPMTRVEGVRLGTSSFGEVGFPGSSDSALGFIDSWWAFSPAAQNGTGLASGQSRSPMPGWVPGQATWQNRTVTPDMALSWFRWYTRALTTSIQQQAATLRAAGYNNMFHVPAAGRGVLPADLTTATNALLNGAGNRDDSLARGLEYLDQFAILQQNVPSLVIDLTSVDDASSVTARGLSPRQDICLLSDAHLSTDPTVATQDWSRFRFARAAAARAGAIVIGENPGPPAFETGGTTTSDSQARQIALSPGYARSCGLAGFLLAFEEDLFTNRSGVSMNDYVTAING